MLIEIKSDIFTSCEFKKLNFLIQIITYKQRYDLFVDVSIVKNTNSYNRLDYEDKAIIEDYFNMAIQSSDTENPKYAISEIEPTHFNIDEAVRFFVQPVSILLENGLNDSYFVETLAKFFDNSGKIIKHISNDWIKFENAGGYGNIKNFIEGRLKTFNDLPKVKHRYLRVFTIIDSDKKYPADNIREDKLKLLKYLLEKDTTVHILRKRNMENYLPDTVLDNQSFPHYHINKDLITIYKNFPDPFQKDFFNLSKGFTNKKPNKSPKTRSDLELGIQNLYNTDTVSHNDFMILDKGIQMGDFKTEFPKLFLNSAVNKQNLSERVNHQMKSNELQVIIDKILKLL